MKRSASFYSAVLFWISFILFASLNHNLCSVHGFIQNGRKTLGVVSTSNPLKNTCYKLTPPVVGTPPTDSFHSLIPKRNGPAFHFPIFMATSEPNDVTSDNQNNNDNMYSNRVIATPTQADASKPQGYASSDLDSLGEGKQLRVLAYIGLALIPCLFLVPFFLARDFVPPIEPEAMIP